MRGDVPDHFQELVRGDSWNELRLRVEKAGWKVPAKRSERKTRDLERWILERFLLSGAAQMLLTVPLALLEGDRPDVVVVAGHMTVGIEVAEITSKIAAEGRSRAERLNLDVFHIPKAADFPTRRSREKLDDTLRDGKGTGWNGAEPELEFAELACNLIEKKVRKASGYATSDCRFLLLYDNSSLGPDPATLARCGAHLRINECVTAARSIFSNVVIVKDQSVTLL